MNDTTTTLTDDQLVAHLLVTCWFRNITAGELGAYFGQWRESIPKPKEMSTDEMEQLALNIGLTLDELHRAIYCARERASYCELALAGDAPAFYALGRRGLSMMDMPDLEPPTTAGAQ